MQNQNFNTSGITCLLLIFLFIWAQSPSLRKLASTCTGWYQPRSSFKFSYSFLSRNIFRRYSHKSLSLSRFFPSLRSLYPSQEIKHYSSISVKIGLRIGSNFSVTLRSTILNKVYITAMDVT